MHVKTRFAMRGLLVVLAVASTVACDARHDRTKKTVPPVITRAVALGSAGPVDPGFLGRARAARDAATKVASGCQLHIEYEESYRRYADRCSFAASDLAALGASATALGAAPVGNGHAEVFAEEVRLFADWIQLVKGEGAQGTLSHYQGLASAWNALLPSERIPVDLRTRDAYDGTVIVGGAGGKLVWGRCSTGPCIIAPRKDK